MRKETLQEFAEYAERFARDHGEPGTLSLRHLERLVAGRGTNGKPPGKPRPATARLLERIFGMPIDVLLSPYVPDAERAQLDSGDEELRARLRASARVDSGVVELLRQQLDATRRLDRQFGALVTHDEVVAKMEQIKSLLRHSVMPTTRSELAALLSEVCTLAGWQALDIGQVTASWRYYEIAKQAAYESGDRTFEAHAAAEQAFILLDMNEVGTAVELLGNARDRLQHVAPRILRSWVSAACGEVLAAGNERSASLRAFDEAEALLPADESSATCPYVALDAVHLARWRGHALARMGDAEAIDVLTSALSQLDATFTRAEAALRVDLALVMAVHGDSEQARLYGDRARRLAGEVGSKRQLRRLKGVAPEPERP